jgi:hypothetical protein
MRRFVSKKLLAVAALLATGIGCTNDLAKEGAGDVFMRVVLIRIPDSQPSVVVIPSDVGTSSATFAEVVMAARSKNPANNTVNYIRAVQLERYEVRYVRSDGRNVEGVDVPYHFSNGVTAVMDIGEPENNINFVIDIVRPGAKLEPPLLNLRNGGGAIVLNMTAEITFYGRILGSNDVITAQGFVRIDFSNFSGGNQLPR